MGYLLVHNKVKDFHTWKPVFDEHAPMREAAGSKSTSSNVSASRISMSAPSRPDAGLTGLIYTIPRARQGTQGQADPPRKPVATR